VLTISIKEPGRNPYSNIAEKASIGDFFVAMTAILEIIIEKIAAKTGAATANPIFEIEKRCAFMPHPSLQNLIVLELL
jgi:hypothetical protein